MKLLTNWVPQVLQKQNLRCTITMEHRKYVIKTKAKILKSNIKVKYHTGRQ